MLRIGDIAPGFALNDENGHVTRLADFRGEQPVVLVFYPGDGTYLCTAQLCEIRDSFAALEAAGAAVFGINPFSAASHLRFTKRNSFPFRLLVDERHRVARLYKCAVGWGVLSMVLRCVYVVGKDGRIAWAKSGKPNVSEILEGLRKA